MTNWQAISCSADGTKLVGVVGGGAIYTSGDSGNTWVQTSAPVTNWSFVVSSADGTRLAAAFPAVDPTYSGGIYVSTDSGSTWTPTGAPSQNWSSLASSADGTKLFAGTIGGMYGQSVVYISEDSGATWQSSNPAGSSHWRTVVACSADGGTLVAATTYDAYYATTFVSISTDSGATWTSGAGLFDVTAMACSADGARLVASGYLGAYTSTNYGATWLENDQAVPVLADSMASCADGTRLVAAGDDSSSGLWRVFISGDAGLTWGPLGPGANWSAVACSTDGNRLIAAVAGGGIFTWQMPNAPFIYEGPGIQGLQWPTNQVTLVAGTNLIVSVGAVAAAPFAYQWRFNGTNISGATTATLAITNVRLRDTGAYAVTLSNSFGVTLSSNVLVTVSPALLTTGPASGITSTQALLGAQVTPGTNDTLVWFEFGQDTGYGTRTTATNASAGFTSTDISIAIAGLAHGTLYHYRAVASNALGLVIGADASFTTYQFTQTSAPGSGWQAIACSADGAKLVAVSANIYIAVSAIIYTSADSGDTWTQTSAPTNNWSAVASSADGTTLVAAFSGAYPTYAGGIYVSTNSGLTWRLTSAPPYGLWPSAACSADGTKLVASDGGAIFTSTNTGVTWVQTSAPSGHNWLSVASSADGLCLAGADITIGGGIYVSSDAGATWTRSGAPSNAWSSVAFSADGRKLTAACGPIYISSDAGQSWRLTAGLGYGSGLAVASSADGSSLIGVGNGISTSIDSGTNWASTGPYGYPQEVCSSADGSKWFVADPTGIYTWQRTPRPLVIISQSTSNCLLSWIVPSIEFHLQQNSDLTRDLWTNVPAMPTFNSTNLQYEVLVGPTLGSSFYRLKH